MNRTVWLVSRRELNTRIRTKAFVLGTAAIVVVVLAYGGIMSMGSGGTSPTTVGVAGQSAAVADSLRETMAAQGSPVELRDVAEPADGRQQVQDGELDALITGAPDALTLEVADEPDRTLRAALDTIIQQQALDTEIAKQGLNPVEVHEAAQGAHVQVTSLDSRTDPEAGPRLAIAMAAGILLYMFLIMGGQMVAQGVVEEKASRVVEILLSTIRPAELLAGKVLGIGITVLLQFAILGVVGVGATAAGGLLVLPTSALLGMLGWTVLWFLLGFFFYATILAAAASLVSRMEDLQSVITPVIMFLVVPFIIGVSMLPKDPESSTGAVLSLIPGFSPVLMPMRTALGVTAPWEIAVAVVLSLAAGYGMLRLGGRVYSNAVLRTGARVKLSEALS